MANGKPGDHPISDVRYGIEVFSTEVDALIRELDELGFWDGPVAWAWAWERMWDKQEVRSEGDLGRLLDHMTDTLNRELTRLREPN